MKYFLFFKLNTGRRTVNWAAISPL